MKKIFIITILIALVVLLLPELSFAQDTLSEQLCELRQMFCGQASTVLISVSVIIVGITTLSGKIHWSFAILIVTAIFFFVNADGVANMIMGANDDGEEVEIECDCS